MALMRLAMLRLSIFDWGGSYGSRLQNLRYRNEFSKHASSPWSWLATVAHSHSLSCTKCTRQIPQLYTLLLRNHSFTPIRSCPSRRPTFTRNSAITCSPKDGLTTLSPDLGHLSSFHGAKRRGDPEQGRDIYGGSSGKPLPSGISCRARPGSSTF
jgi:hypothetical protein